MHEIISVESETKAKEAAKIMISKKIGSIIVTEAKSPVGIVTERDIVSKIVSQGQNASEVPVKDIMSTPLVTINAEEDILHASRILSERKIKRLLVEDKGKIVGIFSQSDIVSELAYAGGELY